MEFRNLLQQADYTLVLPKEDIQPLGLILREENNIFSWFRQTLGSLMNAYLNDLFVTAGRGGAYPKLTKQKLPANLTGSDLVSGNGSFATNFLAKAQAEAGASVKKSKKMLFSFSDAWELSVNHIKLDEYLFSAKLNVNSPTFSDAVKQDKIYVITSVLVSSKLNLRNADDFDFSGDVKADVLEKYLKGSANTSYANSGVYSITSKGDTPLTFAIKAVRILFEKDRYRIRPENIAVRGLKGDLDYLNEEEEIILN